MYRTGPTLLALAAVLAAAGACRFDVGEHALGSLEVEWVLLADGQPTDCAAAGASRVRVTYEALAADFRTRDTFPCELGTAVAELLPIGDYEIESELLAPDGRLLEIGDPLEISLPDGERIPRAPTVTFHLTAAD